MGMTFKATYHRNGIIRNVSFDGNKINDGLNTYKGDYNAYRNLREDLKRQGFKPLPYDPTDVVLTDDQKEIFAKNYGYEF